MSSHLLEKIAGLIARRATTVNADKIAAQKDLAKFSFARFDIQQIFNFLDMYYKHHVGLYLTVQAGSICYECQL